MSDDVSVLAAPQAIYALVDGGPWTSRLERDGLSLDTARAIWVQGVVWGSLGFRELVPPAGELPREAAFWDGLFALLDAGLFRHPAWLRDELAADAPQGNVALAALRALVQRLREDPAPAAPPLRCSRCRMWSPSWAARACEHAEALRRAVRRRVLDDDGLLFEYAKLLRVVAPRDGASARRYVLAPAAELLARRLGAASVPAWAELRRGRTPWRPRGVAPAAASVAVRFACDAWDLPADAVAPAPDTADGPPLTLDLDAPDDERIEVPALGVTGAEAAGG